MDIVEQKVDKILESWANKYEVPSEKHEIYRELFF